MQPQAPSQPAAAPPSLPRYLVLTRNNFGRYSNQRDVLLDALALAAFTGRVLLADPPPACRGGALDYAYDAAILSSALGITLAPADAVTVRALCGSASRAALVTPAAVRHGDWSAAPPAAVSWADLDWPLVDTAVDAASAAAVPAALASFATAAGAYTSPTYRDLRNPGMADEMAQYLAPAALPYHARAASSATCLALSIPFYAVNVALMPGQWERAAAALRPPRWLAEAVDQWFAARELSPQSAPLLALHVRLGDNLKRGVRGLVRPWVDRCDAAETRAAAVEEVRAFAAARGLARAPIVYASDEPRHDCTLALLAAFPDSPHHLVESPDAGAPALRGRQVHDDCLQSQFIQEVLARSGAFFGSALSTFSTAVHQIRVLMHSQPLNSTLFL